MARSPTAWRGGTTIRTVTHVDVRSVARVSFFFYLTALAVFLVMATVLWLVAAAAGLVGGLERFIKSLFGFTSFHFVGLKIFLGSLVSGLILVALATLLNVIGAAVYNLIADSTGGLRFHVSEGAAGRRRRVSTSAYREGSVSDLVGSGPRSPADPRAAQERVVYDERPSRPMV